MKCLLLVLLPLLIGVPDLQVLRATQEVAYQGKPVPITPMGPRRWEQRTPFAPNSAVEDKFRLVVRDRARGLICGSEFTNLIRVTVRIQNCPKSISRVKC